MSTAALSAVVAEIEKDTAAAAAAWEQLVRDLADDREIPAADVVGVCERSGHTLDDLQHAVDRLVGRQLAAEALAGRTDAERDRRRAEQDRDVAERERAAEHRRLKREFDQALADVNSTFDARLVPVGDRLADAQRRADEADVGREHLLSTAPARLRRKLEALCDRQAAAVAAHQRARETELPMARRRLAHVEKLLADLTSEKPKPHDDGVWALDARDRLRQGETDREKHARGVQIRNLTAEAADLRNTIERLDAPAPSFANEIAELEAAMLTV